LQFALPARYCPADRRRRRTIRPRRCCLPDAGPRCRRRQCALRADAHARLGSASLTLSNHRAVPRQLPSTAEGSESVWLGRLTLTDFRNYARAEITADRRPVVLTGPNGAGKTNLLEAVSFLVPGRGLRQARLGEVDRIHSARDLTAAWGVAATINRGDDAI